MKSKASSLQSSSPLTRLLLTHPPRLRQTDVKAGHYERKVQALELDRDQWEKKFEDMSKKYEESKREVDDLLRDMGSL